MSNSTTTPTKVSWTYTELPRLSNRELVEKSIALKDAGDRKGWHAVTAELRARKIAGKLTVCYSGTGDSYHLTTDGRKTLCGRELAYTLATDPRLADCRQCKKGATR